MYHFVQLFLEYNFIDDVKINIVVKKAQSLKKEEKGAGVLIAPPELPLK